MRDLWEKRLIEIIQSSCLEVDSLEFLAGVVCGLRDQEAIKR